jgi:hypothetical protein
VVVVGGAYDRATLAHLQRRVAKERLRRLVVQHHSQGEEHGCEMMGRFWEGRGRPIKKGGEGQATWVMPASSHGARMGDDQPASGVSVMNSTLAP